MKADFETILNHLVPLLNKRQVKYALIGGLAVAKHGYPRATEDIDFLVDKTQLDRFDAAAQEYGYVLRHRTESVSFFDLFGEGVKPLMDALHAAGEHSLAMLDRVQDVELTKGVRIRIVAVEDLIGLKLYAIHHKESRRAKDWDDIEKLVALHHETMNWDLVENYFKMFNMDDEWTTVRAKRLEHEHD